jgi:hypothetical protein
VYCLCVGDVQLLRVYKDIMLCSVCLGGRGYTVVRNDVMLCSVCV